MPQGRRAAVIAIALTSIALLAAWLVARREEGFRPFLWPLAAAFWYALEPSAEPGDRGALLSMSLLPLASSLAYLAAWGGPRWDAAIIFAGWAAFAGWIRFAPDPAAWWWIGTWGPHAASVAIGSAAFYGAVLRDCEDVETDEAPSFTERFAALMLLGDATGLLCALIPGALAWQGRIQLVVEIVVMVVWLARNRSAAVAAP